MQSRQRVLVTGGEAFLGLNIASALLAEGADVTLLVRAGAEDRLGVMANRVRWYTADVWGHREPAWQSARASDRGPYGGQHGG